MKNDTLVSFEGVVKRFGDFVAVKRMDFEIGKGEFLALMGSSGCGKTTTLRMLAGLEAPSEGMIRLSGKPINDLPTWSRDTPMVWQSLALFPFLNVVENVEFALKMRGVGKAERRRRAEQWLDRMQISEFAGRNISQLSGGQRQRVALARSLVVEPEILLLDEPLSALDAALKVRMQSVLKNLQRETGITFVYVTHSQSEAFSMADRVVIMSRGQIEQIGTPQEIYRTPRTRFVADFLGSSNIFTGKVTASDDGGVVLDTASGPLRLKSDERHVVTPGQTATLTVLDTRTNLAVTKPDGPVNAIPVRMIGEEFIGATATIYLETGTGQEIRVQKSHEELAGIPLEIGQELFAWWAHTDGHLVTED
ncbi:MAG: ABC transporter ATP-binding protein [Rhodobacteraceae bacterium]|jgi:spermidine/putrescine transport system ATP-binding protein|nr:ABC transporter ATP-binding protein [uncultured Defluviimonas sp.]MCB2124368.1 ABC transporter ATP-binding protein [Paracoccaceae bacterium]MCC0068401.1 ABC transporter ATP-binding protein [Paracoccaceae bacterium]